MTNTDVADCLAAVQARITRACQQYQRPLESVSLLAVSKRHSLEKIYQAYDAGLRDFGENYVQEGIEKIQQSNQTDICWHFIGKLQSNKLKAIAQHFDWVHTVTAMKHLTQLSQHAQDCDKVLQVCIQVKLGDEASKNGVRVDQLDELIARGIELPGLKIRGLMAIPPAEAELIQQRAQLQPMKQQLQRLQKQWPLLDTLSMGMSADLEAAIAEGATMVRIGTAIFGQRT